MTHTNTPPRFIESLLEATRNEPACHRMAGKSPKNSASLKRQRMWNSSSGRSKSSKKKSSTTSNSSSGINGAAAEKLFQEIADEDDPHVAGMEGISKLCDQLGVDPLEDLRILVLLWKLGANEKPAQISKEEWMQGCNKLQVDSIAKFQSILPSLDTGFLDQAEFKDFYKVRANYHEIRKGGIRTKIAIAK